MALVLPVIPLLRSEPNGSANPDLVRVRGSGLECGHSKRLETVHCQQVFTLAGPATRALSTSVYTCRTRNSCVVNKCLHLQEVQGARVCVSCALGGGAQCASRCFVCTSGLFTKCWGLGGLGDAGFGRAVTRMGFGRRGFGRSDAVPPPWVRVVGCGSPDVGSGGRMRLPRRGFGRSDARPSAPRWATSCDRPFRADAQVLYSVTIRTALFLGVGPRP